MPRILHLPPRNVKKPICRACKRWHARGEAHLGDPRDWNAELINLEPHRDLDGDISRLMEDIYGLPLTLSFAERVAAAVCRRDPNAKYSWLPATDLASDADRTLYVGPAGASAVLRCGVVLQLTRHGRTQLQAPCELATTNDPLVFIALT